jgi:hypothetical protein
MDYTQKSYREAWAQLHHVEQQTNEYWARKKGVEVDELLSAGKGFQGIGSIFHLHARGNFAERDRRLNFYIEYSQKFLAEYSQLTVEDDSYAFSSCVKCRHELHYYRALLKQEISLASSIFDISEGYKVRELDWTENGPHMAVPRAVMWLAAGEPGLALDCLTKKRSYRGHKPGYVRNPFPLAEARDVVLALTQDIIESGGIQASNPSVIDDWFEYFDVIREPPYEAANPRWTKPSFLTAQFATKLEHAIVTNRYLKGGDPADLEAALDLFVA